MKPDGFARRFATGLSILSLSLFFGLLRSQNVHPDADPDAGFLHAASAAQMGELRLAQLAQKQGMSEAIKQFANRVANDEAKAGDDLKALSSQTGMPLAKSYNAKDGAYYDTLAGLSGTSFDGVYISAMVTDHREDIAAFQKEADGGKNAMLKDYASRSLPILQEHLKLAEDAANQLGVNPTKTGGR